MTEEPDSLDLLWGARAIARFIGRTDRQCWEALNAGELPARKVHGRWVASREALRRHFMGEAA